MPALPSYYLTKVANRRARDAETREGVNAGMGQAVKGLDTLAQLQRQLADDADEKERKEYGRDIEKHNRERADARFEWEREDRDRKIEKEDEAILTKDDRREVTMRDALKRNLDDVNELKLDDEVADDERGDILRQVQKSLDDDSWLSKPAAAQDKRESEEDRAWIAIAARGRGHLIPPDVRARLFPGVDMSKVEGPSDLQKDKARKAKADADAAEARARRLAAAGGPENNFAFDAAGLRKIRAARSDVAKVRSDGTALRKALSDPRVASYVGPLTGLENHLRTKAGMQETDAARISSLIGQIFDAYKHAITGAAASDKEMASLEKRMPTEDDTLAAIFGKLDAADTLADTRLAYYDGQLATGDVRGSATPKPAAAPAKPIEELSAEELRALSPEELEAYVDEHGGDHGDD